MKGQVAATAVAMASLAREGFQPAGDVIFIAAADEEVGVDFGLAWLCREHPDAVRAEYSINEGAGDRIELAGRPFYLASTAEKMSSPFIAPRARAERSRVDAVDRGQRARQGGEADRAPRQSSSRSRGSSPRCPRSSRRCVGAPPEDANQVLEARASGRSDRRRARRAAPRDDRLADDGDRLAEAERDPCALRGDRRLPAAARPDAGREAEQVVRGVLGEGDYELEWLEGQGGTRSPMEGRSGMRSQVCVAEIEPEPGSRRSASAGFTDSHWMRDAFGTVAYGFFPLRYDGSAAAPRGSIHSAERARARGRPGAGRRRSCGMQPGR